jgi:YidC/Oxa1 family membrane protein insertase
VSELFQALLDGLGAVLAFFYRYVPNYGVAIILLTLAIRVLLLPLAVKQIHSMSAMQALQPKVKELQRKFKGNRQRLNEEMMKLYREHGVNPLSGCLPLLAQVPVLIALFAVLQFPLGLTHIPHDDPNPVVATPQDSRLYVDLVTDRHPRFLGMNLLCSAGQSGQTVGIDTSKVADLGRNAKLDCGSGIPVRAPYYLLALLMVGTTFYQQRQMQKMSPAGSQQQQTLTRIMPLLFGVWGFFFPAGLVLYWTTTNGVQIAQQHYMLTKRRQAAEAGAGTAARGDGRSGAGQQASKGATTQAKTPRPAPGMRKPAQRSAQQPSPEPGRARPPARSGRNAGDRKKRRKR